MIDAILEYGILKIIYEHDWKHIKNENTGGKSMEHVQLTAIDKNEIYSEKVYRQLKQLIVANHIKPGEILNERELADSLSVSRTPIRDALRSLEQEGWISKKGKFKVVSLLTWKNVQSLMEIRRPLELMSYDLAVQKMTDQDVRDLEHIYENMEMIAKKQEKTSHYEAMASDIEFHLQLARISRNDNVLHIMSELGDQLIRTSVLSVRYGDFSLDTYCSNHSRLLECLKNHEYQKGREELEQHISVWEGHLKKVPEILQINSDENLVF